MSEAPDVRPQAAACEVALNGVGLAPGGGLTYLLNQALEFEKDTSRFKVTYFVAPRCRDRLLEIVPRERVRVPFSGPPGYARRVFWEQVQFPRLIKREGFDMLYSAGGFATLFSPVPQLILDHNPLHHAGRKDLGLGSGLIRARFERIAAKVSVRRAEAVVYPSRSYARAMKEVGFPDPTCIIPSGVSVDWPSFEDMQGLPLECDQCASSSFVLAVHNWYRHKQLEWLARTWAQDSRLNSRHLVIVGSEAGKRRGKKLRVFFNSREVAAVVHVLEGLPRPAVARLYQRADAYVSASVLEAFPLTPFEAMSFGVPIALSDIPPHREVAGSAATYFRSGDVESLVAALAEIEGRDSEISRTSKGALSSWTSNVALFMRQFGVLVRMEYQNNQEAKSEAGTVTVSR